MDVKAHSLGLCKTFRCLPDSRYVTACVVLYISISRKLAKNPHAPRPEQPKKRKQGLRFCQQIIVIPIRPPKMILILISPSKMTLMRIQFRNYHGLLVLLHNQPPILVAVRVICHHHYLPHLFAIQSCHLQWHILQWYLLTLCTLTDQHIQFRLFCCVYDDVCVNFSISCTSHTGSWIPE